MLDGFQTQIADIRRHTICFKSSREVNNATDLLISLICRTPHGLYHPFNAAASSSGPRRSYCCGKSSTRNSSKNKYWLAAIFKTFANSRIRMTLDQKSDVGFSQRNAP